MRKLVTVATVLAAFLISASAQAEHKKYKKGRGYRGPSRGDATAPGGCAIQITVEELVGNLTNGQEDILVGTTSLGKISTIAGIAQGDTVLFASPSFVSEAGIAADGTIPEGNCAMLTAGAMVTIKGSFMTLDTFALPAGFGVGKAFTKEDATSTVALVDATTTPITFSNKAGATSAVGAAAAGDMAGGSTDMAGASTDMATSGGAGSGGGCNVAASATASLPIFLAFGYLSLARRRRSRAS